MRATFAGEVGEDALAADGAGGIGFGGVDLGALIGPEVVGEESTAHQVGLVGEELEGFGGLDGGGEVDGGGEDARGVAGLDRAGGGLGEDAGQACGGGVTCSGSACGLRRLREDVHGGRVGADGGGVNPRFGLLDAVVVEEVAGLEVVGGVEDEVGGGEELVDVVRDEVCDVRVDGDVGVEEGDLASGGLGFGERVAGVGLVEEDLALEVGGFDEVAVDKGEGADAGARQEGGGSGSGGSDADDGDVGGGEEMLAGGSYAGEENLAGVTVCIENDGICGAIGIGVAGGASFSGPGGLRVSGGADVDARGRFFEGGCRML